VSKEYQIVSVHFKVESLVLNRLSGARTTEDFADQKKKKIRIGNISLKYSLCRINTRVKHPEIPRYNMSRKS